MTPSDIVVGGRYTDEHGDVVQVVGKPVLSQGQEFVQFRPVVGETSLGSVYCQPATAFARWARERVG